MANILLTGNTGFLGKYIYTSAVNHGFDVTCVERKKTSATHILCDLSNEVPQLPDLFFDKVIHAAGLAHTYPKTAGQETEMFTANMQMTKHLVQSLDRLSAVPNQFIFISSVAVYGLDSGILLREDHPQNPLTPYGKAKLQSEEMLAEWCDVKGVHLLILRLPLIAGVDAPGNLASITKAIRKGLYIKVKNNNARKSIVLAQDVAEMIAKVATTKSGIYHLTDRIHPTFAEIENAIEEQLGVRTKLSFRLPVIKLMAKTGDLLEWITKKTMPINTQKLNKITSELTFNDDKAVHDLSWEPDSSTAFLKKEHK